jgi:polysaccharide biosynthesis protein PelD
MNSVKMDSAPRSIAELAAFSVIVGGINAFFPANPGFLSGFFNPYLVLALFASALYGKYYAFLSLVFSAVVTALALPLVVGTKDITAYWASLWGKAPLPFAVTLAEVYLMGLIRDFLVKRDKETRERIALWSREKGMLAQQVRALSIVNEELEERISRQEDSITSLYGQVQVLQSLNLSKAQAAILEMVRRFVGASRCSIWEHRPEEKRLELVSRLGWEDDSPVSLPDEDTIEGWVVRNNMMFSVKSLLDNEALAKLDAGRNIITLPISAGRRIWGLLNIEEMPFVKYNLYAEKLLLLIMALAGPALERAIEFQTVLAQEEINPITGLPSYTQFHSLLEKELGRLAGESGTLAVVVFELLNFPDLSAQFGRDPVLGLLTAVAETIHSLAGPRARFFHYKGEGQLVLLAANLDGDGASLLSLTALGTINGEEWKVRDTRVYLEMIIGFAVRAGSRQTPDELLEEAENLLTMQKV